MQQLSDTSTAPVSAGDCAREVLGVMPSVMWAIRRQMRSRRGDALSVPQFRAMILIEQNPSACLSAVAEQVGSSRPSASRLVAGLVSNGLLTRKIDAADRRHCCLALTSRGQSVLKAARKGTQDYIAREVAPLTPAERGTLVAAMGLLRGAFAAELEGNGTASKTGPKIKLRLKPPVLLNERG